MSALRYFYIPLAVLVFVAAPVPAETTTVIHAGTLLAVPGEAPQDQRSLVIVNGRVQEVRDGYVAPEEFGDDAVLVDLSQQFVLPGLMDMHVHFTLSPDRPDYMRTSDSDYALIAAANARTTLLAGITTVRDVGATSAEAIIAVRDAINSGSMPGPRIYAAGESISATAGHGDTRGLRQDVAALMLTSAVCDGADDCRRAVRSQYKLGADVIKVHATGGGADPNGKRASAPEMFDDELLAVVETAHSLDLTVAAHAHGTAGIKAALRAGVDSIEHSSWLDDEAIGMYLDTGTYQVTTAYLQDWFLSRTHIPEQAHATRRANMAITRPRLIEAIRRGVRFAMGTDAGVMPHGLNAREISTYVELGMTPMQAIRTATVNAAELLDQSNEIGTLEPGKIADIIAVDVSPLEDITSLEHVGFVMKEGVVYKDSM